MKDLTGYSTPIEFARKHGCSYTYVINLIKSGTLSYETMPSRGKMVYYVLPPKADEEYENRPRNPRTYRKEMMK